MLNREVSCMPDSEKIMTREIDIDTLRTLIEEREYRKLRQAVSVLEPFELAGLIEELSSEDASILFRLLPHDLASEVFHHIDVETQTDLVETLNNNKALLAKLLEDMNPDDRTELFEELPGDFAKKLLEILTPAERLVAIKLLAYPENSIGRLMTPDFIAIKQDFSIQETLDYIREHGSKSEVMNVLYVTDRKGKLVDDVRIRDLLLADPDQTVESIMDNRFASLKAADDQETAIAVFQDSGHTALPVTDSTGFLLGIVTVDDILDVIEEENTEDFHKFASMANIDMNPLNAGVTYLYRKRILWLFALVFMNILSGAVLASFESTIQAVVSLVFFMPLLIASGGNTGAQSATLIIRSIATGDVETKDWFRLVFKELGVALLLGLTMGIGVAAVASIRAPEIILVVSLSMVTIVLIGALVGTTLPFLFIKLGADPATASVPLITCIADVTGILVYFTLATTLIG